MPKPVRIEVNTRGAARELLKYRGPQVLICGPAGTGKSYAALWKIHLMCLMNPGMRALMVRKTHKSLTSTGLVTFRDKIIPHARKSRIVRWYGGSAEAPAQYIYANGSCIVVGGLDQPDKIMSSEYDVCFIQEATDCTADDWEKVDSRLRNGVVSFQQLIADCNPQHPSHWLKKRCDQGQTLMLYSKHEDNPRIYDDESALTEYGEGYIARLDALTGVRRERLRWGRWAAAEGIIYEGWDPAIHLIDAPMLKEGPGHKKKPPLPYAWERIWSVDFGFKHPFVWQQWAIDPDGRMILELELYKTEGLVEDHAKEILGLMVGRSREGIWIWPRPRAIICDHDAEDRATLERHLGMSTTPAHKDVSPGIQAMAARLRVQKDGKPRLMVRRDALVARDPLLADAGRPCWFGDEIESYVWAQATDGKPIKDEPVKDLDDSMDAARYAVAWMDIRGRTRLRWIG